MATSLSSQLQAVTSLIQVDTEPLKRPFTRPSILFSPKEAADIDNDTLYNIALSGLEVLMSTEERFRNYKSDLFSHKSKEMDRELMGQVENDRINATISSYLRLLSGHFQLLSSLKTLEYLIRRYKIHVYNMEELILCALPYHDTHAFVRVMQLLNFGNTKWKFLDGVKVSGAPPPRQVIVQQCVRDLGILEDLCNYASPTKKIHPSTTVISFGTAVVIETVASFPSVSNEVIKRILPFVTSGIQSGQRGGLEHKAGALMAVSLLASKTALSPKLVKSLLRSVADIAWQDAEGSTDLQWPRVSLMALINLVQSQSMGMLPIKVVEILKDIRNINGILHELSKEFNIDRFFAVLLESLVEYSSSEDSCCFSLVSMIQTLPIGDHVDHIVSKVLFSLMKLAKRKGDSTAPELGIWPKKILVTIMKKYPSELRVAISKFLENMGKNSKQGEMTFETLQQLLDGSLNLPLPVLDSKFWFALHHPKAEVRCAALTGMNSSGNLRDMVDSQGLETIQDVIIRQLQDEDLAVVQAALSLNNLSEVLNGANFYRALKSVMRRCINILLSNSADYVSLAGETVMLCFKLVIRSFNDTLYFKEELATMVLPLLLIMPKTKKYNLNALEFAREMNWPFYQNLPDVCSNEELKSESISLMNQRIIDSLADTFLRHHNSIMPWLVKSSYEYMLSRTLAFLVLMQTIQICIKVDNQLFDILEACLPALKRQWEDLKSSSDLYAQELKNTDLLGMDCKKFLDQLSDVNVKELNVKILVCTFRLLLGALIAVAPAHFSSIENEKWVGKLRELFTFFAGSNFLNQVFSEHINYMIRNYTASPRFLSGFLTEEGSTVAIRVESLHCFSFLCLHSEEDVLSLQVLAELPAILVPLANENQEIRNAAMNCIESSHELCARLDFSGKKNGSTPSWSNFLDVFLGLIVQQKRLILSDREFLSSFLSSLLNPYQCSSNLLVPQNIENRFNKSTKESILDFILDSALKFPSYGKLMVFSLLKGLGNTLMQFRNVELLLSSLLEKRGQYSFELNKSSCGLSKIETDILCLLLESCSMPSPVGRCSPFEEHLLKALHVDGLSIEDPAVLLPCVTVLSKLNNQIFFGLRTEIQETLFRQLISLFRSINSDIQNATRETLLHLELPSSIVVKMLSYSSDKDTREAAPEMKKKKKLRSNEQPAVTSKGENVLSLLGSLFDVLLMKKDTLNRENMIGPLFKLLGQIFSDDSAATTSSEPATSDVSNKTTASSVQQTLLLVLEDIIASCTRDILTKGPVFDEIDINLLLKCARSTKSGIPHVHVLSLLSTIAKAIPEKFLEQMLDVLSIVGESAVTQIDSHSQGVIESLISSIVPFWLSKTGGMMEQILQVFVNILPKFSAHRRLSTMIYLMRILGEGGSLATLLSLLFRSLIARKEASTLSTDNGIIQNAAIEFLLSSLEKEWEYAFAVQICDHYSCMIWLPSIALLLQQIGRQHLSHDRTVELSVAIHFTSHKLQDPELFMVLDSEEDSGKIQGTLGELMEQAVSILQLVDAASKRQKILPALVVKGLKESMRSVLMDIARAMIPSSYFGAMIKLIHSVDQEVKKKALVLLSKTMKVQDPERIIRRSKGRKANNNVNKSSSSSWLRLSEDAQEVFQRMCLDIVQLIDSSQDGANISLKLTAVSALEALANKFPFDYSVFGNCLACVCKRIGSTDSMELSSSCLRAAGALTNVLEQKALANLPLLMENLIRTSSSTTSLAFGEQPGVSDNAALSSSLASRDVLVSVLIALEAVEDKLGTFLNPYLESIFELLVLHPDLLSSSSSGSLDPKLKSKADAVRKLLIDRIPVRLALPPLMKLYPSAVRSGDSSLAITFEMLSKMVGTMDRSSVSAYHRRIFDLCLSALDLRRQQPCASIRNVGAIEESVINAMFSLTMKLTETMFKPLFARAIEWAVESDFDETEPPKGSSNTVPRNISFYNWVNKLAENHRSLFVPYFKYLLEGIVRNLTVSDDDDVPSSALTRKKKKAKTTAASGGDGEKEAKNCSIPLVEKWHLRAVVLSALHKCFLYDMGSLKFLDSTNFQALIKPLVSQLVAELPAALEDHPDVPSVEEVDDLLVVCIGQMAVTAGSDLVSKPLNHEVLMQTRSEKVRSRLLGLRIIKYLVDNLKEEYLAFLPETIPFIGELLEDVEAPVKSLAQDILKELESLSNENLREYL